MKSKLSVVLLSLLIAIVVGYTLLNLGKEDARTRPRRMPGQGPPITLTGYAGEENSFIQDSEVMGVLRDKYGLNVQVEKRTAAQMAAADSAGRDFLWPSSEVTFNLYRRKHPEVVAETIFRSPIVIYAWDKAADALMKAGVVQDVNGAYFSVDARKLADLVEKGVTWRSLGVKGAHGKVRVYSTDPGRNSAGQLFSALLADSLTGGDAGSASNLHAALAPEKRFFAGQGRMLESSADLFNEFLSRGMADRPLVVGYEAQFIEYSVGYGFGPPVPKNTLRILYPRPTILSAYPLIPLNADAGRLVTALKDPFILHIAWRKHGFRTTSGPVTEASGLPGVPSAIGQSVSIPPPEAMQAIAREIGAAP